MNFFKAVFSDEPTPPDSPKSPPNDSSSENPSPEPPSPNLTWSLGSLMKTLATKSESVIEIYKKDLEEFGSGLRKETAIIRDVASRAVHDLPASFEASAVVAQESFGQAIDGLGSTMWKSTAQIISHGSDSILASNRDRDLIPSNNDSNRSNLINQQSLDVRYSRFDAQVHALQCDLDTYCSEPEDKEDYEKWKLGVFVIEHKREEIERLISENGVIREIYDEFVPSRVDDEIFWSRYFYRMFKLKQAEEARALLVKRVISGDEEEDLSWDLDDDKDEGDGSLPRGGSSEGAKVEKDNVDKMDDENVVEKEKVVADTSEDKLDKVVVVLEGTGGDAELFKDDVEPEEKVVVLEEGNRDDGALCKDGNELEQKVAQVEERGDDVESGMDGDESEQKVVVLDGRRYNGESSKDGDGKALVVSSQLPSQEEDEDLGWDEIEDLGSNDESKEAFGGMKNASTSRVEVHKRLSAAEEEEDFSWDIEDDEDVHVK